MRFSGYIALITVISSYVAAFALAQSDPGAQNTTIYYIVIVIVVFVAIVAAMLFMRNKSSAKPVPAPMQHPTPHQPA